MNYMNYGYDHHQTLESAFTKLRVDRLHPMYETAERDEMKMPLVNSSQQTPLSSDPQLIGSLPTPLSNRTSNYMISPTISNNQSTPSSLAAGGRKSNNSLANAKDSIWGQTNLDSKFSSKNLFTGSGGNGNNESNNINNNTSDEISTSTGGTGSASRNLMDFNGHPANSSFDTTLGSLTNQSLDQQQQKLQRGPQNDKKEAHTELESLKLKLQFKETQNESLEREVQLLKNIFNQGLDHKQSEFKFEKQNSHLPPTSLDIPDNIEDMFKKMSQSLRKKDEELNAANGALESILTALALNPTNSMTRYGRYDPEALAHKTVVRLETLAKENQEMSKMLAYGRSKEMYIELHLMKKENDELKSRIMELQQSNSNLSSSSS